MGRLATLGVGLAMGGAGLWIGAHPERLAPSLQQVRAVLEARGLAAPPEQKALGAIAYYRDPDGKPVYSTMPRKTADGRDFTPIDAADDVRFDASGTVKRAEARPVPENGGATKVKFYRNPMGLPDISPVPKKDNMGMDYIPVYESDTDDKTIELAPGKLQSTGVRSVSSALRRMTQTVRVPGTVQVDERQITIVATRSDAYVDTVSDVTTGDRVRKGETLLTLYSPEINAAAAQLIANPGYDGSRRRLENLNVPRATIDEMERAHKVPLAIAWSAPHDGVVLERNAIEGMKAAAGATLFRIANISTIWVLADVPERDIGVVRVGQAVDVRLRSRPGEIRKGRIALIYPQVNAATRSTRIRIELPNPYGTLLPEMYADVAIATGTPAAVVAVPDDAVLDTGTEQSVIVDHGEGRLEPRAVTLGARGDGYTEVRSGLDAGEKVVTGANFLIDAESNLKAALEGLAAASAPPGDRRGAK